MVFVIVAVYLLFLFLFCSLVGFCFVWDLLFLFVCLFVSSFGLLPKHSDPRHRRGAART